MSKVLLAGFLAASGFGIGPDDPKDHLSDADRAAIWQAIDAQVAKLALPKVGERPSFIWPLRRGKGFSQPAYERISNYVDHNAAYPNQLRDYNCGSRTYDTEAGYNHQGIDISIWPDSWNMMQTGQLEIVSAAAGTIVSKFDGNFDQNCAFNSSQWNAVYVRHDDGSTAWYGHMKSGSQTAKPVGSRVAAGEFLGTIGSSGNSTGPHLHFEVYDSNQRLIDPFAGTCNTRNSESWWANQPTYEVTRVNRVMTATAPPVFATCANNRMSDPGTMNAKSDFRPGDLAYFVIFVRDAKTGQAPSITIRRPDGSVWRTNTGSAATGFVGSAYWWFSYTMPSTEPTGTWTFEGEFAGTSSATPFTLTANGQGIANYTDLWWNPAESGWGVNLNHQGGTVFATWFTYDTDGSGMWLVMPDASGSDTQKTGTIYRSTGVPLTQINGAPAANFPLPSVGTGTFTFTDRDHATFAYTVNGISQAKTLQRQVFGTAARCVESRSSRANATNYQDLWWNASESGWGINLTHQGETMFATWFTYAAGGRGQWLVASDLRRQPTGEFTGRLYRTTGRRFDQIANASAVNSTSDVGSLTLTFTDGERGRMDYTVDGVTQTKQIVRQAFGTTAPLCH